MAPPTRLVLHGGVPRGGAGGAGDTGGAGGCSVIRFPDPRRCAARGYWPAEILADAGLGGGWYRLVPGGTISSIRSRVASSSVSAAPLGRLSSTSARIQRRE